jgi:zinc transport system ATP-binding protein
MDAIEVKNLYFEYNNQNKVIENLSFNVKEGEFVGVVGPNGSGKTTLIKILIGSLKQKKGTIKFFGKNLNNSKNIIGYVPQKLHIDSTFPATVNELLGLLDDKKNIKEVLKIMEIEKFLDKKFSELSGGQQQRVIATIALSKNPKILILDEPSSGIDLKGQTKFNELLSKLNKTKKTTIILISHDTQMISKFAKKALCIGKPSYCFGPTKNMKDYLEKIYGKEHSVFPHKH